jgi:16S rRNA (guanine527-N7)-methyltransferase
MDQQITEILKKWGVALTEEQERKLELFKEELLIKNSRLNLFSGNDAEVLWPRHILDALAGAPILARLLKPGDTVADAGAGAGFPGVPLAVVLENFKFDLWDSSLRRQLFLTWAASRLRLGNVRALHSRIGQSGPAEAERYGAVVERAMGKLENILPQCLNMVRPGGVFLAWQSRGDGVFEKDGGSGVQDCRAEEVFAYRLPREEKDRFILVFRKPGGPHAHS